MIEESHTFKAARKSYFMHYLYVVIILLTRDFYNSVFSTYTFKKLVFVFLCFAFFICTVLNSVSPLDFVKFS